MGKEWPHSKEEAVISLAYLMKRAKKKQFTEENGHPKIVPQYLSRGRSDLAVKKGL